MQVKAIKTSLFKLNDLLIKFINNHLVLEEGDVLVITSKIVALAEGRVGKFEDKEKIIAGEAKEIIKTPWADLTLSERGWEINAGVDESNADEGLILLPKDSWQSAEKLQTELKEMFGIKNLGVIISDTRSVPLRIGTVGRVIGCAGFLPIKSYVGKEDLYGRKSRVTISNIADALATSAVLMMGEGDEQTPLAIIKNAPVSFTDKSLNEKDKELNLSPEQDIFSYIYRRGG
jgi:coenzyme F420-0:L-glutamate ligase